MDSSSEESSEIVSGHRPTKKLDNIRSNKSLRSSDKSDDLLSIPAATRPTSSTNRRPNKKASFGDDYLNEQEVSTIEPLRIDTHATINGDGDSPTASRSSTATFGGGSRTGTPLLDQTISAAFRTRIRSRIKTVKESVTKTPLPTRQIEGVSDLSNLIEARLKGRKDWQTSLATLLDHGSKSSGNLTYPSPDQSYDFFASSFKSSSKTTKDGSIVNEPSTSSNYDDGDDGTVISDQKLKHDDTITINSDDSASGKLLVKQLFASTEELHLCERSEVEIRSTSLRREKEAQLLTITSNDPIPDHIRFGRGEGYNPRNDGLYCQPAPKTLSQRNINKLYQRLYRDSGLAWFQGRFRTLFDLLWTYFTVWITFFDTLKIVSSPELTSSSTDLYTLQPTMSKHKFIESFNKEKTVKYRIEFNLHSIQFTNHLAFGDENILAAKLLKLYRNYRETLTEGTITLLNRKIESLKISLANVTDKESEDNGQQPNQRLERLINYRRQLSETFIARRKALTQLRSILLELLSTWEELVDKRRNQEFSSTTVKLTYKEEANQLSEEEERKIWNNLVEEDFKIQWSMVKETYARALADYRRDLRSWKSWQRSVRRSPKHEDDDMIEEASSSNLDASLKNPTSTPEKVKPEPPPKSIDENELKQQISAETLLLDGRVPGEPKFTELTLSFDTPLSSGPDCPAYEQKRRSLMKNLKYFVEVKLNGSNRTKTIEQEVDYNFVVTWDQRFIVDLTEEPKEMTYSVWEKKGPAKLTRLTSGILPWPDAVTLPREDTLTLNEEPFQVLSGESTVICSGNLFYSSAWSIDDSGTILAPASVSLSHTNINIDSFSAEEINRIRDKTALMLDPNDPDNIKLLKAIRKYEQMFQNGTSQKDGEVESFSSRVLLKSIQFVDEKEIENNPRFKLIKLRASKHDKFNGIPVPLLEREIPLTIFSDTNGTRDSSVRSAKGIEAKREKALAVLFKIRSKLMNQSEGCIDRPRTWDDIVSEPDSHGIDLGFHFFLPSHNRRPLHPTRKERKKISGPLSGNSQVQLIITIMHAFNVPVRIENGAQTSEESENRRDKLNSELGELTYESRVSPFVEVVFQRQIERTNTAYGAQPTWNETLSLALKAPNDDFSPSNLITINDWVYLNLFDEISINSNDTSGAIISQRLERRWLGSLKIPFSTLYFNSKIEGTFKLNTPPVLLGYEYDSRFFELNQHLSSSDVSTTPNTYLTLFLTIDPTLQLPEPLTLKCDSKESEKILIHGRKWESLGRTEFPERAIRAFAIDLEAQFVLITRYIRPIKPPESLLTNISLADEAMHRLARFVSLIPSIPDNFAVPGTEDIWIPCDQFLDMLIGDEEEHAILLCNFFLYLGKRAGVILGFGIPEGLTAYVIVWEYTGQEPSVWNPISGEKYNIRDSYIPLNAVGTIFTSENVYANIQKQDHPNRLNYDVTKASCWKPLFNRKFPNPGLTSIQPEMIDYEPIDEEYIKQLQNNLEKNLRESLMRWRKNSRTFFNRTAIQQIRKILPRLEKKLGRLQQNDLITELQDILTVHKMIGFPLNMPYTSEKAITEAVYATGLHLIEDRKVDFALAVYLHPYPCNLMSVWVYIAALLKDK
ncbi:coiled-coil and C2 domain-containing protein 2A-like [Tetranychus urticae]|uniref:coiled-coil and C2 domain-containing protein 2A-like n=1 Tax=Tetranychus urticae TaxID=32264 RepID=UPI000D65C83A|nr:coiled-coil and C2 domain-containing protein 2A-like [Tetranychus urticae]